VKAAQIAEYGGPEVIRIVDLPVPEPGNGQLRVRVASAGVAPWDVLLRENKSGIPQTLPLVLGSDIAGVVDRIGAGVSGFAVGDEVYGLTNGNFMGGYAEYSVASASSMARKPKSLNFLEAASAPVIAVTAWQMLFQFGGAQKGQSVLIHGAGGNVGAYAVQMARDAGLRIFATASVKDLDYVRGLGAQTVLDYRAGRFEDALKDVDVVVDLVGGEIQTRSVAALKRGGILVSAVSQPAAEVLAKAGARGVFFIVDVTTAQLNTIAELFDAKKLAPKVGSVLPLADARLAHQMLAGAPHKRGKILLSVAS
jgi:NADPH:quinone reductase-like Zn-dependent oxidoreductase